MTKHATLIIEATTQFFFVVKSLKESSYLYKLLSIWDHSIQWYKHVIKETLCNFIALKKRLYNIIILWTTSFSVDYFRKKQEFLYYW